MPMFDANLSALARHGPRLAMTRKLKSQLALFNAGDSVFDQDKNQEGLRWNFRGPSIGLRNLVMFLSSNLASINRAITWSVSICKV